MQQAEEPLPEFAKMPDTVLESIFCHLLDDPRALGALCQTCGTMNTYLCSPDAALLWEACCRKHKLTLQLGVDAKICFSRFVATLCADCHTAFGRLRGKETSDRNCGFGERILWFVPNAVRSKLVQRWRDSSDTNVVGLPHGNVIRARAIVRLAPEA